VRRRSIPLAIVGALLVAGCALAFALAWQHAGGQAPVLAVSRTVPAGQVITAGDLAVVRVSAGGPAALVPASQEQAVTGRPAAVTLPAGSLLTSAGIGAVPVAAGQAMLGVAVRPGQFPPDLAAGATVDVLALPPAPATTGGPGGAGGAQAALPDGRAVVVSVTPQPSTPGAAVVELQVSQDAMPQIAAASAAGQLDLATVAGGS
jgi:hypothetical protein